ASAADQRVHDNDNSTCYKWSCYKWSYHCLMTVARPAELHDRERPWEALADFVSTPAVGTRLGLVYGRRRQGKTLLLELLAQATGGLMFTGQPQAGPMTLRRAAEAYADYTGGPAPAFTGWDQAVDTFLRLGERRDEPTLIVLDEFPYLMDSEP